VGGGGDGVEASEVGEAAAGGAVRDGARVEAAGELAGVGEGGELE
jgi:hypothetical protein